MNHFIHAFRTTSGRFRWEIIVFWLMEMTLFAGYLNGFFRAEPPMSTPFAVRPAFDRLEILIFCWIVLRVMASEPVLLTQGGWRVRPIPRFIVWIAPFAVLVMILLPPLLLRLLVIQSAASPDVAQWGRIFTSCILPAAGWILLGALFVRTGSGLLTRRGPAMAAKIVFGLALAGLMAAWFHPASSRRIQILLNDRDLYHIQGGGGGSINFGNHVLGIQEHLPPGAKYAGDWEIWSPPAVRMREVVRFPIKQGLVRKQAGIRLEVKLIQPDERKLDLDFDITAADPKFITDLWNGTMVLRYAGNIYAFRRLIRDWQETAPLAALPVTTIHCIGRFDSPIGYLWNDRTWGELLDDAELMVFVPDKSLPPIQVARKVDPPKPVREKPSGLAGDVEEVFDGLDYDLDRNFTKPMAEKGSSLPHEALPHVLARHPWSDNAWEHFVKPFLLKHADVADKAALLDRMDSEPRLGEIMVIKGWKADALPLLRRIAEDRLPLDVESLTVLAQERDPKLAKSLSALAARLDHGVEKLEPLLRVHPGFDWKAFVHEGWMRRKYSFRRSGPIQPFDLWAAQEGDVSALRHMAEQAARGKKWEAEQLAGLVAGEHADLLGWLREHIGSLRFDAAAGRWVLP